MTDFIKLLKTLTNTAVGEYEWLDFPAMESPQTLPSMSEIQEKETSSNETTNKEVPEEEPKDLDPCKGIRVCPCKRAAEQDDIEPISVKEVPSDGTGTIDEFSNKAEETTLSSKLSTKSLSCVCETTSTNKIDFGVLGKCEYTEKGWILIGEYSDRGDFLQDQL